MVGFLVEGLDENCAGATFKRSCLCFPNALGEQRAADSGQACIARLLGFLQGDSKSVCGPGGREMRWCAQTNERLADEFGYDEESPGRLAVRFQSLDGAQNSEQEQTRPF